AAVSSPKPTPSRTRATEVSLSAGAPVFGMPAPPALPATPAPPFPPAAAPAAPPPAAFSAGLAPLAPAPPAPPGPPVPPLAARELRGGKPAQALPLWFGSRWLGSAGL